MEYRAVDVHVHVGNLNHWKPWVKEWWRRANPRDLAMVRDDGSLDREAFIGHLEAIGVKYAVVLAERSPATTCDVTTWEVLEFCEGEPRLIPFCNINIHLTEDPLGEFREYLDAGVRGLKIHPVHQLFYPNHARLYPLYALAQERGIPVMFHTGSSIFPGAKIKFGDPLYLDDIAVDFPDLTIIMSHGGRGFWYDRAQFLAKIRPNVYIDVSGLPPSRLLDYFPDLERLKEKFLFGTDWPGAMIDKNIEALLALPISPAAKEAILMKNATRLLGLDEGR